MEPDKSQASAPQDPLAEESRRTRTPWGSQQSPMQAACCALQPASRCEPQILKSIWHGHSNCQGIFHFVHLCLLAMSRYTGRWRGCRQV